MLFKFLKTFLCVQFLDAWLPVHRRAEVWRRDGGCDGLRPRRDLDLLPGQEADETQRLGQVPRPRRGRRRLQGARQEVLQPGLLTTNAFLSDLFLGGLVSYISAVFWLFPI